MGPNVMIQLVSGAEQIGLAVMLKDLIDQNLEQHPHKLADFKKLDIRIGLSVSDADIDLTLDFKAGDGMTIHAGIKGKPELCIDTDAEIIIALSNQRIKWGLPYCFDSDVGSLEPVSKMSFGPISLLGPRFKSSTTNRLPAV
jgi:hypothetical protein